MTRMGHDSMRAALIYQHNTQGADRKIADAMEALIATGRSLVARGSHDECTGLAPARGPGRD